MDEAVNRKGKARELSQRACVCACVCVHACRLFCSHKTIQWGQMGNWGASNLAKLRNKNAALNIDF